MSQRPFFESKDALEDAMLELETTDMLKLGNQRGGELMIFEIDGTKISNAAGDELTEGLTMDELWNAKDEADGHVNEVARFIFNRWTDYEKEIEKDDQELTSSPRVYYDLDGQELTKEEAQVKYFAAIQAIKHSTDSLPQMTAEEMEAEKAEVAGQCYCIASDCLCQNK